MNLVTLILLTTISSSMPSGTQFEAKDAQTGKIYHGRIISIPAARHWHLKRWRDWNGSLRLEMDRTVVVQVEAPGNTVDSEGTITPKSSTKRTILQLGEALVAAKAADDVTDLIVAAHGTAINGWRSKVAAACAGLFVYFFNKGKDAKLPAGTAIQVNVH